MTLRFVAIYIYIIYLAKSDLNTVIAGVKAAICIREIKRNEFELQLVYIHGGKIQFMPRMVTITDEPWFNFAVLYAGSKSVQLAYFFYLTS